jgi:anti-sigma factor (TIGR02949 family)
LEPWREELQKGAALVNPEITISCKHVWQEISNFIEGDVDAELRARIAAHLQECQHCSAVYDGTTNVLRLVADGAVLDIPGNLSTTLYARLKDVLK